MLGSLKGDAKNPNPDTYIIEKLTAAGLKHAQKNPDPDT
jgi:hypothetical protein